MGGEVVPSPGLEAQTNHMKTKEIDEGTPLWDLTPQSFGLEVHGLSIGPRGLFVPFCLVMA